MGLLHPAPARPKSIPILGQVSKGHPPESVHPHPHACHGRYAATLPSRTAACEAYAKEYGRGPGMFRTPELAALAWGGLPPDERPGIWKACCGAFGGSSSSSQGAYRRYGYEHHPASLQARMRRSIVLFMCGNTTLVIVRQ